ncbi:MAG: CDC48 family AAA ATPase [Nanoarchaeota archaeon]|nr:CDC48 family AAA ATPase [Nanoarchaeota archaeon]
MNNNVKVKVADALQDDLETNIVRINSNFVKQLGLSYGSFIGIKGKRETVAVLGRSYPSDLGLDIIRMNDFLRENANVDIGEEVLLYKIDVKPANKIVLSSLNENFIFHPTTLNNIKNRLLKKPLSEGDIICPGYLASEKKKDFSSNNKTIADLFFNPIENEFLGLNLGSFKFKVEKTAPSGFLYVDSQTKIEFTTKAEQEIENNENFEDIGGLKTQIVKIRELIDLPLKHPEIFSKLGIDPPKGILLFGPPGTGKTLLARAIAKESSASFYSISGPEIVNKFYGESEKKLREIFDKASKNSPAIIFFDEIDTIAAKREEVEGETEKRIVAQLLTLMDGLNKSKKVIVIAATNRPDALDEALRRPGRFDRELEIGVPKEEDRFEILKIHTRGMPLEIPKNFEFYRPILKNYLKENEKEKLDLELIEETFSKDKFKGIEMLPETIVNETRERISEVILKKVAVNTHGFVGADLEALVKEAAFNVLRRFFPEMDFKEEEKFAKQLSKIINKLEITQNDFSLALGSIRPSALREYVVEIPKVKWEDIGGLKELKGQLKEMIEWPLTNPEAFKRLGIKAPKGILLYGPPGTGKTLLAKAVATETSSNFISINGPELITKGLGDTEKAIRKIFKKARQNSPCILFFDEFDSIASTRHGGENSSSDAFINQFLTEMDGLEDLVNVKILAATNRPKLIDPALLRPGRFDKLVLVDIPDIESRKAIFEVHLKNSPVKNKTSLIDYLASKTEGYVGADIEAIVREAGLNALRKDINSDEISEADFNHALKVIKPSINVEIQKHYEDIEREMKDPRKDPKSDLSMSSYM